MGIIKRVFDFKGSLVLAGTFVALFIAEGKRPLRKRVQKRTKRVLINSIVALPAFTLLRFVFLPVVVWLAFKNQKLKLGLNYRYNAPPIIKGFVAFLLMDYTNYLWHVINHKLPLLWRFHVVHHTDPDLDITTALRFHFGELVGSVFYRGGFVFLSGATPLTVLLYEIVFEGATQFHHSNMRLPFTVEKALNKIIVTPRMHGIHHSIVQRETDSNYSVIFSFWDRLHKTVRLNVEQEKIVIGVPQYSNPDELTIGKLLTLPFTKIRKWPVSNEPGVKNNPTIKYLAPFA
jgi:sterol desaturase/sphingolipid hydroxylase (fatty acid hydroxylase superfamily)